MNHQPIFERSFVTLPNGFTIAYSTAGNKALAPMVLLHGLTDDADTWEHNVSRLSVRCYCIMPDLPGHGQSDSALGHSYSLAFFADILQQFLAHLGITRFSLAGHSMGGQLAIYYALHFGGQVSDLALIAPAGFEVFSEQEKLHLLQTATVGFHSLRIFRNFIPLDHYIASRRHKARYREAAGTAIIMKCVKGMLDEPVFGQLPQLNMPVLVIFGEKDRLIPNPFLRRGDTRIVALSGASIIKRVQLHMIADAGHFVHQEYPEKVSNLLLNT